MRRLQNEQISQASPSILDAQNEDVNTAIQVLEKEAESLKPSMEKEMLEATVKFLRTEVLR